MNATKRKFNTLLQGLGSPRSTENNGAGPLSNTDKSISQLSRTATASTPPTPSKTHANRLDEELMQKRRRLGLPPSTAPLFQNGRSSLDKTVSTIVSPRPKSDSASRAGATARYSPSDRDQLLKRLSTFQEITDWAPKPDQVNEVEWAKRGWVCCGKETVRCLLCHRELVVKLNRKLVDGNEVPVLVPSEIDDALVAKYSDLIITSHQEECLWRKRGCDDSILRLALANASNAIRELQRRYEELCSRKSFLPYEFNLRVPDELDLDQIITNLPHEFLSKPPPANADPVSVQGVNKVALTLALFGWQGLADNRIGQVPNSASCHTCLRRLGLWMFKSKQVSDTDEVLVPAPMDFLDPAREHRFFCPWVNPSTQASGGSHSHSDKPLPGWRVLLQTLANDAHLRSVYEGRPATAPRPRELATIPSTPQRPTTAKSVVSPRTEASTPGLVDSPAPGSTTKSSYEDGETEREAKDKERWARLKRVKSLFDVKGRRKSKQSISRPGTGHSTKSVAG